MNGFLKLAEGSGVTLIHENEKRIYGDTPEKARALYNTLNHPGFALCYDASNYIQCGVDSWEAHRQTKRYTVYYHMKDCAEGIEVPLGTGEGRIPELLADLNASGYGGFLTLEPHTLQYALLKRAFRLLPFATNTRRGRVFRQIDREMGVKGLQPVSRAQVLRGSIKIWYPCLRRSEGNMNKVRYGIVGIGKMGGTHAKKLKQGLDQNGELAAVCDLSEERLAWAEQALPGVRRFADYRELLACGEVDAVVVATPHYDHPGIAMEALEAGKHVLIEKPAGVYTSAVRALNELARQKQGQVFGIMYNQRTNPLYREAKRIIDSGGLGELKRINWVITNWYRPQAYYDQGGWRGTWSGEGGGVLINQCPHQLDLFQWLGGMPIKVRGYAKTGMHRRINVENDVTFYTEYENGASGVFVTSTHDYPGTNRLEISGDGGRIVIEQNLLKEKMTFCKLKVLESDFNRQNEKFMPQIPHTVVRKTTGSLTNAVRLGLIGQHMNIFRNFSRAVLHGEPLIAPGAEGIRGLALSNAVYLSSWLDQEITLPLDEALFASELEKRAAAERATRA